MILYHVSEEPNITKFVPRIPDREDLDKSKRLVWALDEKCLPSFLTPRDCPHVAYYATEKSSEEDIAKFYSSSQRYCVAIESDWYKRMTQTSLYVYQFDSSNFKLQDEVAGYYVSEEIEVPIAVARFDDLFSELFKRNVEVRILDDLWQLGRAVQKSTLAWGLYRMRNARLEIER